MEKFVGPPRREVRESTRPERFFGYLAQVTNLHVSEPATYEEAFAH